MSIINITAARDNLFKLVNDVNIGFNPITIVNNKGKNAVLISEDEWNNISETLYLYSIPGLVESVIDSSKESKETRTKYVKGEKW
ncbi:MAG: type II toxin-antitoxin system Phd/YefM family antitoxin [Bacilli bacterium]|nr:type II toxin-antitoxin system Phd/YefM family antitoxin [Bacilli bacterium]